MDGIISALDFEEAMNVLTAAAAAFAAIYTIRKGLRIVLEAIGDTPDSYDANGFDPDEVDHSQSGFSADDHLSEKEAEELRRKYDDTPF